MTVKVLKCRKCGAGENMGYFNGGILIGKSGGATLIKQAGDQYICTDCHVGKPAPRRIRRASKKVMRRG